MNLHDVRGSTDVPGDAFVDTPSIRGVLRIYRSARLEALVDALNDVVREPLVSPFAKETIVVPSRAMGDWLALRLAEKQGIWANPSFVTIEELVANEAIDTDTLTWAIAAVLPSLLTDAKLAPVATYLEGDADGTKRHALARRLAATFRRYLTHRPAMITAWERGEDDLPAEHAWQPVLWRAVAGRVGREARHPATDAERLSVFAPEALSPAHADALAALPNVHVFARSTAGHPLATSLGTRNAETLATLEARAQSITDLDATPPSTLPQHLSVHACHAPMRECEVLRDQLLAALNDDPTLEPRDVLVLCPDLDTYAPVIDAVFGVSDKERTFLPYRIVDRASRKQLRVVEAFLALLDLIPSRLTAPDVVDFLSREPVRAKFDLEENELDTVRRWVSEVGIRWGEDEAHRAEVGQPALRANTWRFGLDRLIAGYAIGKDGSHDRTLCENTLPYDDVEGHATSTLGGLSAFCEELFFFRKELSGKHTLTTWQDLLRDALARLFHTFWQTEFQHAMVRDALTRIADTATKAGFAEEVPLAVVRDALAAELEERGRRRDVAAGGVTFAAYSSGRATPARVVVLLGMNDGDVPRAPRADGFDLLASSRQPGDPSVRDDDRQAFLDALLSARERLIVTYVGQSIANNAERPPSVLVSELLDLLSDAERKTALVRHPLHAFSPTYFGATEDIRLFSHADSLCEGAQAMSGPKSMMAPFARAPLPPSDLPRTLTLDQLVKFFEHPTRAFMMTRLRVFFGSDADVLEDREPLELDALEAWKLGAGLLERGERSPDVPADLVAEGALPLGVVGAFTYAEVAKKVAWIRAQIEEHVGGTKLRAPLPIELDVAAHDTRIVGWVKGTTPSVHLVTTYSNAGGKHRVGAWVRHVAMNAAGLSLRTVLVCKNEVWQLAPLKARDAEAQLRELVALYWRGLEAPLLFFPETSIAYVERLRKTRDENDALTHAEKAFGKDFGDGTCPYIDRAFGGAAALHEPTFASLATELVSPMLAQVTA